MKKIAELINESKHFCVLPWIHFHAWPNGKVMPCCVSDSSKPVAEIKQDQSILELMNSEDFKRIRSNMLQDKPSDECKRCYDLEMIGSWTMRQSHNKRRGMDYIDIIKNTNQDGSINEFQMKYMDIRFSNFCNFKCRTCGPGCSSKWAEEFIKKKGVGKLEQFFSINKAVVSCNEDQIFMTKLKPYLKDVTEVYFAGGESLITPEHYECLDYWIDNNLTEQVELTYTTNFSMLKYKNRDLIKLWKKFPNIKIWASLDAHGKAAEIIRKGTDWDRILANFHKLKKEVPHAKFEITPTISIWNVYTFPEFFDHMVDVGMIDKDSQPRFNLLTYPWWANIMILPDFSKEYLIAYYRTYVQKYSDNECIKNGFRLIQANLKSGSGKYGDLINRENKGGILEFIQHNNEMDKDRKEKLLDIIPELEKVYQWAKN
jgi:Iron-sulfur cluster-binding domain